MEYWRLRQCRVDNRIFWWRTATQQHAALSGRLHVEEGELMKPFELCPECAERLRLWIAEQEAQETQEKHILTVDELPRHSFADYPLEVIIYERNL